MPRMLRNLSIRSKLLALLAVPVAGTALLGATGLAATAAVRLPAAALESGSPVPARLP
jgi:hypothetical protein